MEKIAHYCQKCRAANQPGEHLCWRCGTRLMLVVVPPSVRHEETFPPTYYEDHLLERVSLLELRLSQIVERLSVALDLMLRQTRTIESDHILIETILDALGAAGIFEKEKIKKAWREREKEEKNRDFPINREDEILNQILLQHDHPNAEIFTNIVKESLDLLNGGEEKQGLRMLERAIKISPRNALLMTYTAEKFFLADKFDAAKKYLERAYEIAPQEPKILLLSGVICADEGNAENARRYLSLLVNHTETVFCVNYIWAFLAASEDNWTETLAAFKETLRVKNLPETNYLTACAYFQLRRFSQSRKYLQKAVEHDAKFSDAWFMLGATCEALGDAEKSAEAFENAWNTRESGAQSLDFLRRRNSFDVKLALPFMRMKQRPKNLLTGNARRLSKLFREELFKLL